MASLLDTYPLKLLINGEDFSFLLDEGATWSNADPGGYEAASFPIPRDCPELFVGMPVRIDCGLDVVWEGQIQQIQRSLGNKTAVTCRGYGGYLADYLLSMVYVDRDLTRWADPSYTRQIALVESQRQFTSGQVAEDPTNLTPAIAQNIQNSWVTPWLPQCESWYDSGPNNLAAQVYFSGNTQTGTAAVGTWFEAVALSSDANLTTSEGTGNLAMSTTAFATYFQPATPYRFALLQFLNTVSSQGVQGANYATYWNNLAVYGPHGLTGRGSDPVGFYTSDIVTNALQQLPSGLLNPGIIPDATGFIVPHYTQHVPVPIEQIISDMAGLAGAHYGVWESLTPLTTHTTPRLDFRPYPTTATAFVYRGACDAVDITEDLTGMYDSTWVTYTDTAGVQQAVYVTLDNPYLDNVGLHRTLQIDAGTSTGPAASTFGAIVLNLSQISARASGSTSIRGLVEANGGSKPAFLLKSGLDRLAIVDLPGQSAYGPTVTNQFQISRIETTVSSSGVSTQVDLGNGANLVEVLQARLQIASTLASVV